MRDWLGVRRLRLMGKVVSLVVVALVVMASAAAAAPNLAGDPTNQEATSRGDCIDAALTPIHIRNSRLTEAGKPTGQYVYAQFVNDELPSTCEEEFHIVRHERFAFKVQDPLHRARWVPVEGHRLGDTGATFNISNRGGFAAVYQTSEGANNWGLYKCAKGRATTGARVEILKLAVDTDSKKPLAKRLFRSPIKKILPKRC